MNVSPQPAGSGADGKNFADYHPCHHAPHDSNDRPEHPQMADGQLEGEHGDVNPMTSDQLVGLRQRQPERKAGGIGAVLSSFHYA